MKSGQEQNKISDLLKKLRQSYLGASEKEESPKKKSASVQDDELESKLRAALSSAQDETASKPKARKSTKSATPKKEPKQEPLAPSPIAEEAVPVEVQPPVAEEAVLLQEEPTEQADEVQEAPVKAIPARKPKATPKQRAPKPQKSANVTIPPPEEPEAPQVAEAMAPEEAAQKPIPEFALAPEPETDPASEAEIASEPEAEAISATDAPDPIPEAAEEAPPPPQKVKLRVSIVQKTNNEYDFAKQPATEEETALKSEQQPLASTPAVKVASPAAHREEHPTHLTVHPTEPVRERNVTLPAPSADTPGFQKRQPDQNAPIVIRPRTQEAPRESIVISPKSDTSRAPIPQPSKESFDREPIRIGRKSNTTMNKQAPPPKKAETETEQKTAAPRVVVHPTRSSKKPKDTVMTATASKPLSRPTLKKAVTKKKPRVSLPESTPIEDPTLEEVLDDVSVDDIIEEPMEQPEELKPEEPQAPTPRRVKKAVPDADAALPIKERIAKQTGLNEDDLALVFELGYDNELGQLVGYENLKQLRYEHLQLKSQTHRKHYRTAIGYRGEEQVGAKDRDKRLAAYAHDKKQLLTRTVLTALVALLSLFTDLPQLIGERLAIYQTQYPLLFPLLGILFLCIGAALSFRQLNAGVRRLLKFEPTPYSVSALLLPLALVYDIIMMFAPANALPVNFLILCTLLLTAVCDVLRYCCELRTVQFLTSQESKIVLEAATPRKKKLRQGNKIVKIINDDAGESHYRVRRAKDTIGFFRRFNNMESAARPFTVMLIVMLSLAIVLGFAYAIHERSFFSALSFSMTVLLLCAPLCAVFNYFYPIFVANRLLARVQGALVGEEAVAEYAQTKTVIFDDVELLSARIHAQSFLHKGDDFKEDLQIASMLFRKLGGTLGQIASPLKAQAANALVSIVRVVDGGVEAMVNHQYHVLAGDAAFLKRNGIPVPPESTDRAVARAKNVGLLYVAVNGTLKLSYEVEYSLDPKFEAMIAELAYQNTVVGLHTYDPNLSDAFLIAIRPENADPIRTIRPGRYEENNEAEVVDTGAVAVESTADLPCVLAAANGIFAARRFGFRMQIISSILAGIASILLGFFGGEHLLGVLPVALYQLFWVLVTLIAAHSELNRATLRLKK